LLWNLQLNKDAKLSVAFLLSMGVLASISACIRLKYTVNLKNSTEYLHSVGDIVIWGCKFLCDAPAFTPADIDPRDAENGVGFVVGCTSTLRPLFRRVFEFGPTAGGPSDVRNYTNVDPIEFSTYTGPKGTNHTTTINTSTGAQRRSLAAYDSGSESEEHLVKGHGTGIRVSKSVRQLRE
jgi:hypothetical protein